jgi:RND family efflux transporter MFP subunit
MQKSVTTPDPHRTDPSHGDGEKKAEISKRARFIARATGLGALVALALLVAYGARTQAQRETEAAKTLKQVADFVPTVRISPVQTVTAPRTLDLPGTTRAFDSATIFARATGYISQRRVDIGSKVNKSDVLVTIAAPDLDQQLAQARAQVTQLEANIEQARANADLAVVTNKRTSALVIQGWQTKQQGDVDRLTSKAQQAALDVAQANLNVQKAAVARLEELTSFERVIAPFNGVITSRNVDVGDLMTADASSGTPMFSIDRTDVLRVQVFVPQDSAFAVKDDDEAEVIVPEIPGRIFKGKIARNAGSLQPGTRTLLIEVDVPNPDGALRAGIYCTVRFNIPRAEPTIIIPSQAVIFDSSGLSAAVYDNGTARLRHLGILRDNGAQVEVRTGLKPGDQIILSPPVNIKDGMRVKAAEPEGQDKKTASNN